MDQKTLDLINKFTRRPFTEEELFVFSVVLCDNDIDRDNERFSDDALVSLKDLFIGKTGIFDHDSAASNQNARIFRTEVVTDEERSTKYGKPYKYLKAMAYMVRTDENSALIAEIDGGIKKEVSISCSAAGRICSVCGCDKNVSQCSHVKGKSYNGQLCHTVLTDITDAYEWSFVAVPAQVNAGVTKRCTSGEHHSAPVEQESSNDRQLRSDIRRLAYFTGGLAAAEAADIITEGMETERLASLKSAYESAPRRKGITVQLMPQTEESDDNCFTVR